LIGTRQPTESGLTNGLPRVAQQGLSGESAARVIPFAPCPNAVVRTVVCQNRAWILEAKSTRLTGTPWIPTPTRVDNTIVKAIVRAHRWRDMLESGRYATVRDLAKAETINESYLGRILRLTLLSPTIIEAILEDRQPPTLELDGLLERYPVEWDKQLETLTAS
jgi:hypothetical protein